LFISAKAKHTYSGYAISQLKRLMGHHRWLTQGPKAAPERADYGLPEHTLIPKDQLEATHAAIQKKLDSWQLDLDDLDPARRIHIQTQIERFLEDMQIGANEQWQMAARFVGLDNNFIELMQREREYRSAHNEWKRYLGWKKNRNPERAALEAKFGMDLKHACLLVRLLKMGKEILLTGKINVWRGDIDSEELLAIRNGAWGYDQLVEWAKQQDDELHRIYREKNYTIPHKPKYKEVNLLCQNIVEQFLNKN